jgi:LPXTG-motif cell wall-anchored protein
VPVKVGQTSYDQQLTVACDAPGIPEVSSSVECAANDGTIVVVLGNEGVPGKNLPVTYTVTNPTDATDTQQVTVDPGQTKTVEFGPLPDGAYTVPVEVGEVSYDQQLTVACDGPGIPEVDSSVECTADGGQITVTLGNEGEPGKNLPVTYTVTNPTDPTDTQQVTVDAGETKTVVFEDLADGTYTVPVTAGETSYDQTVTVRCAAPEVLGIAIACADGGFTIRVGNDGTNPTTMTFLKGTSVVDEVVVAPDSTVEVLIPMVEGETADITVLDGDEVLTVQTVTYDCTEPTTTTTTTAPPEAEVRGTVQTAQAVTTKGSLPYTGGEVLRMVVVGLGLALAGFGLVLAVRRRRA